MWIALLILGGLISLTIGADLLVRGAARLAASFGVPSLIVGLTIVAFGTSAPELAVSISSSIAGKSDVAFGNVLGSNIFNVACILGLSAIVMPLIVDPKLLKVELPLVILSSLLVAFQARDGRIDSAEGVLLFLLLIGYLTYCFFANRPSPGIAEEEIEGTEAEQKTSYGRLAAVCGLLIAAGLALLVIGSYGFVEGATRLAQLLNVSDFIIGLTIVAAGTSLPELATSIVAAIRGEQDLAIGNVIGSNLFNLLAVLGLASITAPSGITVAIQAIHMDLPIMILTAVICVPVFYSRLLVSRSEGAILFIFYLTYLFTLIQLEGGNQPLGTLQATARWLIFAMLGVCCLNFVIEYFQSRRASKSV